jgi:hypothetical protein
LRRILHLAANAAVKHKRSLFEIAYRRHSHGQDTDQPSERLPIGLVG